MLHKCKVTVMKKECYTDLQAQYLANPQAGPCPVFQVGDEFVFERYIGRDDFQRMDHGLRCAEAWDCISRFIYSALQGGSIMRKWTNDDRMMIACCNDGTRPVIFKIERIDYKALYIDGLCGVEDDAAIQAAICRLDGVTDTKFNENRLGRFLEVMMDFDVPDDLLCRCVAACGAYRVIKID